MLKFNIGVDIQQVSDFDAANSILLRKIFTNKELKLLRNKGKSHLAGLFSAKEAVIKACNPIKKIRLKEVEVFHNKDGSPYVKIRNQRINSKNLKISISHSKDYSAAVAIVSY